MSATQLNFSETFTNPNYTSPFNKEIYLMCGDDVEQTIGFCESGWKHLAEFSCDGHRIGTHIELMAVDAYVSSLNSKS